MTPDDTRLMLDVMCGDLARLLRMCGYDAAYAPERGLLEDPDIADAARRENRVLVTRDTDFAGSYGESVLLDSVDTDEQLDELREAGLELELTDGARCSQCNGKLATTTERPDHAPDGVERVWKCTDCGQFYWQGSHWRRVEERL
ncbi:DUF5615 family PIN-like protein [Salarchaeum sp. JOR-1]|uniref:DUF5615 family PIN-like protein n=1 Tax=Salarchaeum sp. JOR-1 TaxID=2599399 RepID=UPI001198C3A0|nr:DUF5615 family PIN-like protein [Salarchaeum sp. JOR-1]QDX39717.1 hypothetical protein FQU85_01955 [Salarchaeum sp. JOR-1]